MAGFFKWKRGDREALLMSLGLWAVAYLLFLLPTVAEYGSVALWRAQLLMLCIMVALPLSLPVYLAVRAVQELPRWRQALVIAAAVAFATIATSLADSWFFVDFYRTHTDQALNLWRVTAGNVLIYAGAYGLYAAALALILSTYKIQDRERQLSEARAAAHQAQLAALRFQLNPHFLFNTLNAISTLIVTGRNGEAELMMQKLSDFLRASLSSDPDGFITLDDELATIHAYLEIESVRFGERLAVDFACPTPLLDALVPSFILQPLVENAIKYAVAPSKGTVTIRVEAAHDGDDLTIMVEDDGQASDRAATRSGTGVGLHNVRARLEALFGARGSLEATPRAKGFLAVVRLPLTRSIGIRKAA
ncbi:MAG TPA: histidine kinase [Caulobacteraceae bacterium]|jgi:sensor histidine kinase YesM